MNFTLFNNLSSFEQLGVIGSIASIIGLYFYFSDKQKTKNTKQLNSNKTSDKSSKVNKGIEVRNVSGGSVVINDKQPTFVNNNIITPMPLIKETIQEKPKQPMSLPERKSSIKIVFIDDDIKFKVVKILINTGWINTKIIKDAKTIDEPVIKDADILFVDVQGVGILMGFKDEGLGLALALKTNYPKKKIVIYSAEIHGDRFHEALRKADSFLPKNADPYEFQKLVEELSSNLDSDHDY